MCGRLNIGGRSLRPGEYSLMIAREGHRKAKWGFNAGMQYNARLESLEPIWYPKKVHRGILEVNGFLEGNTQFWLKDKPEFDLAVIYNDKNEFAVITTESDPTVREVHNRMPLLIGDRDSWMRSGDIIIPNEPIIKAA